MRGAVLLACLLASTPRLATAANDNYPVGARHAAMAQTGVMIPDFWSFSHNQAGLGFYQSFGIGIHHENKFLVREFALHAFGLTVPAGSSTLAASYSYFGYPAYHESKVGLGIGKAFHERFAAGIQLDYLHVYQVEESGRSAAVAAEAGVMAEPADDLYVGFHIFNPTGSKHKGLTGEELIPVIIRFGLGYTFAQTLFVGIETEKDMEVSQAVYRTGLEYRINESISARGGIQVAGYVQHSFGIGFALGGIRADVSFMHQQVIGYSPYVSFLYQF